MVSKNNIQLKDRYATKQVPHYGIRKLSVGVASVLLSTTLYMGVTAHADTIAETNPQPIIDQPTTTATGNAIDNVQLKPTADQSESTTTNSPASETNASSKPVQTVSPEQPANATDAQPTAVTSGSQLARNFNVESDNNGSVAKPVEQSTDPATLMTNFAVTEQPVNDTNNSVTTTLTSKFTWAIHYTDETGKKLLPDSVITHDYTRTDTGDQMGNWSYVPNSLKVTGTSNNGWHIDNPNFKFDQAAGGTTFDFATWYAAAASIDGYTPNYGSVVLTDQLPKNPESLHATSMVDSGTHEFTFVYTKQPTKVTINYVDDEQGEKVVGTGTVSGKSGTAVTITPSLPRGYMLTPNKDVPSTYTVTDAADQAVTIHVQKQFVDTSATDPQAKQTRTITLHYVYGAGDKQGQQAFDDAVLDVYYHRTATLDRATNQTTYGDWMWDQSQGDSSTPGYHVVSGKWTSLPQTWANVVADVPSIKGYYADLGQNDPTNTNHIPSNTWVFPTYNNSLGGGISEGGKGATAYLDGYGYEVNPTHTIKYMPNKTTVTVNYVDDDNNKAVVGSQHWDGTTGQHIDLTLTPPDNYVLTPGWVNPSSYDFDGVNSAWYTVHVKHATQDVTDQQSKDQISKTETLTRKHLYGPGPHEGEKFGEPDILEVPWHRTATKDLVTNKVSFGDWHVIWDEVKQLSGATKMWGDSEHNWVNGGLIANHSGYSYLGVGAKTEAISKDGTVGGHDYHWAGEQDIENHPTIVQYYGREKVGVPVNYVDFDTNQQLTTRWLTGDNYLDGNTITLNKDDLIDWGKAVSNNYQLYAGQTLPTTYKIDTVTNNGSLTPITVYVVQPRTVQFTFADNDSTVNGQHPQVGDAVSVTGITGSTTPVSLAVPVGYKLVEGQQLPTTYTFVKGEQNQVILLTHQHTTVQPDSPKTPSDKLPDNPGKNYPSGVAKDDLTKTVTRKVTIVTPDGKSTVTNQTVTFTRNATVDEVTGKVTYGSWSENGKHEFATVDVPTVSGYTATGDVPSLTVTPDSEDTNVTIDYTASQQSTQIVFVDNDGKTVDTVDVNGKTGETVETNAKVPDNWKLVDNETVPSTITFSEDTPETLTVHIEHKIETKQLKIDTNVLFPRVIKTSDNPNFDDLGGYVPWISDDEFNSKEYWFGKYADAGLVTGSVQYDLVSGKIVKVNNGETLKFGKTLFNYPSYEDIVNGGSLGDTAAYDGVKETFADGLNKDTGENLNYKVYASANLTKDAFTNKYLYGPSYTINNVLPFTFKNGKQYGSDHEIDTSTINNSFSVNFNDLANVIDSYHIHNNDDGSLSAYSFLIMPIAYQPYISKTATRTINITNPDGTVKAIKQTAEINQNVSVEFDWKVHHGEYLRKGDAYVTDNNWSTYEVPNIPGYTASQAQVNAVEVNGDTTDQTVNISYTANKQSVNINYVDVNDGNKVVHTTTVSGVTDGDATVTNELPTGYKLVDGQSVPKTVRFNVDNDDINIKVQHTTVTVTPDAPKTPADKLPDNPDKAYPAGVSETDLNKTVTRTIKVTTPDGQTKTTAQVAKLTRTADVDEVTGEVTYGKWTTGEWDAYEVPALKGYTASQTSVAAIPVDGNTKDQTINISYTANSQTTHINYVDDNGKIVHTTIVNGVTGQTVKVLNEVPAGWTIVKGQVPSEISFGPNGHSDETITISHQHVTVDPDHPQTNGTKLPDNSAKTFNGVEVNDLNKTVTRIIKVITPDGQTKSITQTAKLTRTADVDEVTGEVTYGNWTSGEWNAYEVPSLSGYTASQTSVEATQVDENTKDQTVEVSYTPNKQTTTIKYVDDKGQTIHTTTVDGVTDQTVKVPSEVPAGWAITKGKVPSEITFGADGHEPVVITVAHQHVTVDPDYPQTNGMKLPDNPAKTFNGVEANDLNKTIIRIIKVTMPDGQTKTVAQTAKLTRTADVDEVTGEVTYGKWTTGKWSNYDVPTVLGYTPSQDNVPATEVTSNTTDQMVDVSYTPNKQSTTIKYVDDKGQTIHITTVNGVTDQTVKVPNEVPTGWFIITGKVPSEITFGSDGYKSVVITVGHSIIVVFPHTPKTSADALPDNPSKHYPAGVGGSDLNKTVTRTIKITQPDGTVTNKVQTVKLTRAARVDEVTGEVLQYSDWSADGKSNWDAYEIPSVEGYTASQTSVEAIPVDENMKDQTVEVSYTPNKQTTTIKYVDDKDEVVHTTTVDGVTDQTVKVSSEVPAGWTITKGKVPSEITFGADGHEPIVITVDHQHVTVDPNYPQNNGTKLPDNPSKTFNGVEANDLNKTITRTIKVTTPGGQTETVSQIAKLTRTADVDEVTGEVTYSKWTTGEWAAYDVPSQVGYTASQTSVEAAPVDENTKDQTVNISYTANSQTTHINYVDGDGKTVHTTTVNGVTGQTVKVPNEVPAGWTIVKGQVPSEISFGPNGHSDETITISHQHVTVDPDHPQTNGTELPDNPAKTFNGVEANDLNKTITRTIKVTTPDGKATTTKQTVKLTRTADVDEVTGEVTYGKWTTGEWNTYEVPVLNGYTASQTSVEAAPVDENTKDQTVEVSYTPNKQSTTIKYVDDKGDVVHTTTVTGVTDQTVKVPDEVPAGWTITKGKVPSEMTFGVDGHEPVVITVGHQYVTVDPDHPQTNGTKLPDNPAKTFEGVEANDLNKVITRTIKVTTPDGQTKTVSQTVKLTRTADVDEVTGEVTYGKWTTGQWNAYEVPALNGYTASQTSVEATPVDENAKDQTVEVSYTPNSQSTTIKYVDDKGQTIHTTTVNGVTNQTVKVPSKVPAGWTITKGKVPSEITFGVDGHEPVVITVGHQHVTVDPDYPQNNGTKLPDNPAKTFEGVEANDLNKTITRTIKVTTPDGKVTTAKQTAKLTRTADVDEVTGEVTYGDWTTDEWAAYDAPSVAGYTPSQTKVDNETVTAASKDTTTVITYSPVQHQISVEYVDDDDHGKVVKTDQVPGKTDQTITVMPTAPVDYELVDSNNRTYTVTSADGQTVQIHVKHHQVTTSESKTVTRTINVHTLHDGVKTVKQTVTLNRDVTTDQVTGDKTYGGWTTGQWKAYTPEAIPGYTPSINEVPNTNVDGSLSDQTVEVTYTANPQTVAIVYVDDAKDGAVVKTDQVAGKTNETVKVTPDVPAGYKVVGEVSGSYTLTANGHQTITVHLVHQMKTTSEDKTVTRTINVHTPHDGTKVVKQTAKLTRDVTTDQVTGEKTYGDWSATEWDRYAVPAVAGYVPSIEQVAQQVVNGTTTDQAIDVTYSSGEHTTHINYVDGDGNIVHTTTIKGQTDGTAQVPNETPAGWTVVGEPVPTELAFGPDGHADVTVTVDHQHVTVTPDQPKVPTDKLPDNPAKTYPNGVGHDDLNKTITRTIKVTMPDGQTKTVVQTTKLTRTANVDEVTGAFTYGRWTTGEWSNYDVPVVPGYTPSQSKVPATKVTDDTKDQTVTVTYTANDQTTHINYVDGDGEIVHTTTVTGKTDQTVKVPNEVPAGWTITDGHVPSEVIFGANGHDDVTVTVDHQHVTVTPDKPQTDGTKLPNNPSQTFHGVAETDLNKAVTRTIEVASPARKTTMVKQTAKLTRTADVDEVTGEVTYGKWTTGAWSSYSAPTVPGYTPSQAVVAEAAVYADTTDQTVKIMYTADSHTTHINYVDEDGKVVHTTTVTGQTDQTVKVPNETPAGWTIATGQVPSEVTFGPDGYTDVTITVDHRHVTVTPDKPQTDGTKLPDKPALTFHDVDHDDLNKTVTRTIKLNVPGQVPQVITQTVRLTRTATVDEVTGEVTYGDWTTGQWDAYEVPAVDGYTASQTTIPAVNVTSETTSQEIVVDYVAVPTAQTTPINNQTDENQVTPEKVVTVANGTVQETKQGAIKNSGQSTMQDTKQLPQTGNDNRAGLLSLIGSSLMASLAIFGLSKKKKH